MYLVEPKVINPAVKISHSSVSMASGSYLSILVTWDGEIVYSEDRTYISQEIHSYMRIHDEVALMFGINEIPYQVLTDEEATRLQELEVTRVSIKEFVLRNRNEDTQHSSKVAQGWAVRERE